MPSTNIYIRVIDAIAELIADPVPWTQKKIILIDTAKDIDRDGDLAELLSWWDADLEPQPETFDEPQGE